MKYSMRSAVLCAALTALCVAETGAEYKVQDADKDTEGAKAPNVATPAINDPAATSRPVVPEPEHPALPSVRTARQMILGNLTPEYAADWLFRNRPETFASVEEAADAINDPEIQ